MKERKSPVIEIRIAATEKNKSRVKPEEISLEGLILAQGERWRRA